MLDANKPDGSTLLSELADYQRETREYLLSIVQGMGASDVSTVVSTAPYLIVGEDLSLNSIEVVKYSGVAELQGITGGFDGMMKIFLIQADTIDIINGSATNEGELHLNGYNDLDCRTGDIIAFVNVGGDLSTGVNGYWKEMYRTLAS